MPRARVVLASASPRRRELLARAGLEFDVVPSSIDEDESAFADPVEAAQALAERKALAVARAQGEPCVVLGADTVVAVESAGRNVLLGKPDGALDARRMLGMLSGTRHQVVTGVCALARFPSGALRSWRGFERTWVTMRRIEPEEAEAWIASGEWRDKAGGYAIQEGADRFVTRLEEGGLDNVVGLPVGLALELAGRAQAALA